MAILIYDSLLPLTESNLEMNYERYKLKAIFAESRNKRNSKVYWKNNVIVLLKNSI